MMVGLGTKKLSKLFTDDIVDLKKFLSTNHINFLEISPGYGIDWKLKGRLPEDIKIVTRIKYHKNFQETIKFHAISLGVIAESMINLLSADTPWEETEGMYNIGIDNVVSVSQILDFSESLQKTPAAISLKINPLEYPKEILDYCKREHIPVYGFSAFGGDLLYGYLESLFPKEFLFDFAATNTDVLFIPGDDPYFIRWAASREIPDSKLLRYSKEIHKSPGIKLGERKIFGKDIINKFNLEVPGNTTWGMKEVKPDLSQFKPIWEDEEYPVYNQELHRYHSQVILDEKYSPKIWKKEYKLVGEDFWIIKLTPVWYLGFLTKEHIFWLISGKLIKMPSETRDYLNNVN